MKKSILASVLVLALSGPAFAQGMPPGGGQGGGQGGPGGSMDSPELKALQFKNHKDEMLKSISNRIAEMQLRTSEMVADMEKKRACVEAAATQEALKSCMPPPMGGSGHGGGEGGGMMGKPPEQKQ
jgi:hypothetical protein